MLLSILISTYNYNCYQLVAQLQHLCEASRCQYEIIVGDDHSRDQLSLIANKKIEELPHCRMVTSATNHGQAYNRNRLAAEAQGEWLLFIDSDAMVDNNSFITNYLQHMGEADVIIGGVKTPTLHPDQIVATHETADLGMPHSHFRVIRTLRYRYEQHADATRSAVHRNRHPFLQFTCFNAMIRRDTFMQVQFDEQCTEYGHEDTLFGISLKQRGISILHIDNQLLHMGIDTNEQFLRKTETALRTLKTMTDRMEGYSHLLATVHRLQRMHLTWLAKTAYILLQKPIKRNLLGTKPSLFLFSFYKLGYFLCLK